jgi:hypothetical protein
MTPADIIKPFLEEADRRKPHLRIDNRFPSCFELLEDTLALAALAGHDFQFIGKTSTMDGAAFRPVWYQPREIVCVRPDGQQQPVLIDGLGMDAAWHVPTTTQVKVIVNSTANEPGPHQHGPAHLTPYMIARTNPDTGAVQYRWHNPPIPQRVGAVIVPMPPPVTQPPAGGTGRPGREEMMRAGKWLHDWYKSQDGLQRPLGLWVVDHPVLGTGPDWEGIGAWLFDVYFNARLAGKTVEQAKAQTVKEIRNAGPEWQSKHPGETP